MGFNYEIGKFTPEPHNMLPAQVSRLVSDLEPGDSAIVAEEAVWVDRTPERETWIDGNEDALTDDQVIALGNPDPRDYSRIHRVKHGLVLDNSHLELRSWDHTNGLYLRRDYQEDEVYLMPIIHCVFNSDELGLIKRALRKNGIKLKTLVSIFDLTDAVRYAVDIEGDYEEFGGDSELE